MVTARREAAALSAGTLAALRCVMGMGERQAMASLEAFPPHVEKELSRETLEALRAQDAAAFRRFVVRYERSVFALVSRIAGSGAQVEDLAQEVFLRAYRAFPTFDLDGPASVSTWLLTIAVRLAINARKHDARAAARKLGDAAEVRDAVTPETERARRELGRAIARAAEELSDDQRAAFVLAEFHGMPLGDIAAALEIPEGTVKTRLFRARAHLRERLADFQKEKGKTR
jgi:RNA polymerase sigma-70 factor (ECF subfamily)